jgi:hypothetical protein
MTSTIGISAKSPFAANVHNGPHHSSRGLEPYCPIAFCGPVVPSINEELPSDLFLNFCAVMYPESHG